MYTQMSEWMDIMDREKSYNWLIYLVGFLLIAGGLAVMAVQLGVPSTWVIAGALVLLGIAVVTGVTRVLNKPSY